MRALGGRTARRPVTAILAPVTVVALLSGNVVTSSAGVASSTTLARSWLGTVQVTTEVPRQTEVAGPGYTFEYSRTDSATYTLTGNQPVVFSATMRGQGAGRAVNTFSPPNATCVAVVDPVWAWSYSGPASVEISYSNGAFSIRPRGVQGMVRNAYLNPECAGGSNEPFPMVLPPGIEETAPTGRQTAPATASRLSGSQTFPWQHTTRPGNVVGTTTVTWDLRRVATPPSAGVLEGTALVNGRPYTSGQPIPYGSTVDVTNGRLALTTEVGALTVYGGGVSAVFKLLRAKEKGKPLDELRLVKGDFSVCNRRLASAGQKKKPPSTTVRRLWAKGKGNFRTRGRYSSSTVRGTFWLTADRCDGTLTSVRQGRLEVFDFVKNRKLLVGAGKSYLAARRG